MPSSKEISSAPYAKKWLQITSLSSITSSSPTPFPAKDLFDPEHCKQNWALNLKESGTNKSFFQKRLDKKEGWKEGIRWVKPGPFWIRDSLDSLDSLESQLLVGWVWVKICSLADRRTGFRLESRKQKWEEQLGLRKSVWDLEDQEEPMDSPVQSRDLPRAGLWSHQWLVSLVGEKRKLKTK